LGWPKAFCSRGVSGVMVLEPSIKNDRNPHQRLVVPANGASD